jgi:hypothetical protein
MKWSILFHIVIVILIVVFAISPMIPVSIAASIAERNNCVLHEGFVNPCVVNGVDMGQNLYTMGMMGWFIIATIPLGLSVLALYIISVAGFYIFRWFRSRKLAQEQFSSD